MAPPYIFGYLDILEPIVSVGQLPPFVTTDLFNSLIFLSRLLKTHDKLNALDIRIVQNLDPHFRNIMTNALKHKDFVVDKDRILFKHINHSFFVLRLPRQFAVSIIQSLHKVQEFHVPRDAMLRHYNSRFVTPKVEQFISDSINGCLKCFLSHNTGVKQYKMYKRSITDTSVGEHF